MSTNWSGTLSLGGGVTVRVGLTLTWSAGTATWLFQGQVAGGSAFGTDTWFTSGDVSASGTRSWNSSGTFTIGSGTIAFPQTASAQTFDMSARLQDVSFTSSDLVVNHSITVPANAAAPAPVTGLTVTRVSDTRQNLAWTNQATGPAPYNDILVRRRHQVSDPYATVAVIAGSLTSYADTSTVADRRYEYAIQPRNSAGMATTYPASSHSTTPATPSSPSAVKLGNGDVVVTRPALSPVATGWDVRTPAGTVLISDLPAAQTSWTHTAPAVETAWSYQIRTRTTTPVLTSGWSTTSNTIAAVVPPLAPTNLTPSVADATEAIVLGWTHRPADGSPQTKHEVQTRATSGDAWVSLGEVTSGTASRTITADTWSNPGTRQWQVRTWGQHADPGAWSATGLLSLSSRPVAGVVEPSSVHPSQRLTVGWTYHDDESSAQGAWRVRLLTGGAIIETLSGLDSSTSATLATSLQDGGAYTVQVEVMDGAGMWSDVASQAFTVDYAPPPAPTLSAQWRADEGYTVLSVSVPAPTGVEQALDHVRLERATEGGWVVIADRLASGATVTDMIPPTGTVVTYRAVAVSDIESEAYASVPVDTSTRWLFLNHGPGFGEVVRVWGNLRPARSYRRAKTLKHYAGRALPVERAGHARSRTYNLTAALFAPWHADQTSTWDDVEALEDAAAPVCVRDPEGTRMFVSVGGVDLPDAAAHVRDVSVAMTQVDYAEDVSA